MARRLARLPLLMVLALGGCSYVCHSYSDFSEPVTVAQDPVGSWKLSGRVDRYHREGWQAGPGSWPHWAPEKDDRYRLVLRPVAADTAFWAGATVDLDSVAVIAGRDTFEISWAEVEDLPVKHAGRRRSYLPNDPWPWPLTDGKLQFTSEFFQLGSNLPDTLFIEGVLEIQPTGQPPRHRRFRAISIKDPHVRWSIVDMAES